MQQLTTNLLVDFLVVGVSFLICSCLASNQSNLAMAPQTTSLSTKATPITTLSPNLRKHSSSSRPAHQRSQNKSQRQQLGGTLQAGETCWFDDQCASNNCVNEKCSAHSIEDDAEGPFEVGGNNIIFFCIIGVGVLVVVAVLVYTLCWSGGGGGTGCCGEGDGGKGGKAGGGKKSPGKSKNNKGTKK